MKTINNAALKYYGNHSKYINSKYVYLTLVILTTIAIGGGEVLRLGRGSGLGHAVEAALQSRPI